MNIRFIKPYELYHMSLIIVFIELCYNYSYYFPRFVYVPSPHMKDVLVDILVDFFFFFLSGTLIGSCPQ